VRTAIIAVDPEPRITISNVCDEVHQLRLEDFSCERFLSLVTPQTVIFFDGSHRSFPGSDVTIFFLDILPKLPSGTIVHIHDVYIPNDYPQHMLNRLWSEQYLLAAFLLSSSKQLEVLLACAYLASKTESRKLLSDTFGTENFGGCSFWLRII
jgi:hypothetical protein